MTDNPYESPEIRSEEPPPLRDMSPLEITFIIALVLIGIAVAIAYWEQPNLQDWLERLR